MDTKAIFLPALAMAALTCIVWLRMFRVRIRQMYRDRIHPQSVATSAQALARFTESAAADNFRNLFELPVLFYLALSVAAFNGLADTPTLTLAWLFVAMR
ncbi:MAPEG family protein, partial [Lysobacter sp. 2RAB21]